MLSLMKFKKFLLDDLPQAQAMILSQDKQPKLFGSIQAFPRDLGIKEICKSQNCIGPDTYCTQ